MLKNIALIGMPGCGKTTVGKIIADKTGIEFIDMDEYIEKTNSMKINEMFEIGEDFFRKMEAIACVNLSKKNKVVIATGGGVVKTSENIKALKKSSIIVFINRPLNEIILDIETDKRPLLKDGIDRLYRLYDERIQLYKEYCNIEVENKGSIIDLAKIIVKKIDELGGDGSEDNGY